MNSAAPMSREQALAFEFTGKGSELLKIFVVNTLLTILTLGIYSAWAKVRLMRYLYGHSRVAGHGFEYLGEARRILLGRIIAILIFVGFSLLNQFFPSLGFGLACLLVLFIPCIIASSSAFLVRNTAYRNVRMQFHGSFADAYGAVLAPLAFWLVSFAIIYFLLPAEFTNAETGEVLPRSAFLPIVFALPLLPLLPWLDAARTRYVIGNAAYGNLDGDFSASVLSFYALHLRYWARLLVLTFGAGLLVGVCVWMWRMFANDGSPEGMSGAGQFAILFLTIALGFGGLVLWSYCWCWMAAERANLIRNKTRFGDMRLYGRFKASGLFALGVTNTLFTLLTLGVYLPWAIVRSARYNAHNTFLDTAGLDGVVAAASVKTSATGEAVAELFDIDLGL